MRVKPFLAGALALALLPLAVYSEPVGRYRCAHGERGRHCGQGDGAGAVDPFFEFAPTAGTGLPSASTLCDAMAAGDKTGNYWCWNGADNSMMSGSAIASFTAFNSPTAQSTNTCPNGPDCAAVGGQLLNGTNQYFQAAAAGANPAGDFSVCALVRFDRTGVNRRILDKHASLAANNGWWLEMGDRPSVVVYKSGGTNTTVQTAAGVTTTKSGEHLVCATYDFITDGTSELKMYLDGTAGGLDSAAAVGPPNASSAIPYRIGTYNFDPVDGTENFKGRVRGVFFTETELSAARIAEIARSVLADKPTGSKGEVITFARNSLQSCAYNDSNVTVLPKDRPCIRGGGMQVARAIGNRLARSEELENAAWSNVATPTTTADTWTAPSGAVAGDTIDDNDAAAYEGRSQAITTATLGKYIASCYFQSGTATTARMAFAGTGNAAGDGACTFTGLSGTTQRLTCTSGAYAAGLTAVTYSVMVGDAVNVTGSIKLWGCQVETQGSSYYVNVPRYYVPTAGTAVTPVADSAYATVSTALALKSQAGTANILGFDDANYTRMIAMPWKDGSNNSEHYANTTNSININHGCAWTTAGVFRQYFSGGFASPRNGVDIRLFCSHDGNEAIGCMDNTGCLTSAAVWTMYTAPTRIYLGTYYGAAGLEANGLIKKICADTSPTGCPR